MGTSANSLRETADGDVVEAAEKWRGPAAVGPVLESVALDERLGGRVSIAALGGGSVGRGKTTAVIGSRSSVAPAVFVGAMKTLKADPA